MNSQEYKDLLKSKFNNDELANVFFGLHQELVQINIYWSDYQKLMREKDLLNATAPNFFSRVVSVFDNEILLSIARMMDPATQGRDAENENLSLRRLQIYFPEDEKLKTLLGEAGQAFTWKDYRRKSLAHRDLQYALGEKHFGENSIEDKDIHDTLEAIESVLNHVNPFGGMRYVVRPSNTGINSLFDILKGAKK